jgi:CO/xanthine dehydrogenase Mo-binding subunit
MAVRGVLTNTVPIDAYRGAGKPEANYLIERLVDRAARRLALDPVALRRRNLRRKIVCADQQNHGLGRRPGEIAVLQPP